ncbi:MAG TPA: glycosyltransferase [Solirubrobacteraceae bacterium]
MVANSGGPARRPGPALVDGWYRWFLPEHRSFGDVINRWPERLRPLVWRYGAVRAITLVVAGRKHDAVAAIRRDRGWRCLVLLSALLSSRPKLVVLHFIDNDLRRPGVHRLIDACWQPIERWALRRTMARAQVLTVWEGRRYAEEYGVEQERFRFVPFAWRHPPGGAAPQFAEAAARAGVVAAGRVSCDWPTLFAAAQGQDWPLTVVCSAAHRVLVESLNRDGRATVLTDIPQSAVQALLRRAAISVIATYDAGMSQGHVRLCESVDAGAPIVATRTRSLEGYVEEDRTAVLVAPGAPEALRDAIEGLLADPAHRDRLAQAAWSRAERWTWDDYLAGLSALMRGERSGAPQAAASACAPESSLREITLDTPSEPIDTP